MQKKPIKMTFMEFSKKSKEYQKTHCFIRESVYANKPGTVIETIDCQECKNNKINTKLFVSGIILFVFLVTFLTISLVEILYITNEVQKDTPITYVQAPEPIKKFTTGKASWYDYSLVFDPDYSKHNSTCASRDYPKGTILEVSSREIVITCRVNDYGPEECPKDKPDCELKDRIIDLSSYAFKQLAPLFIGEIEVMVTEYEANP